MTESVGFLEQAHLELAARVDQFARAQVEPRSTEEPDYITQARELLKRIAAEGLLRYVAPSPYGGLHPYVDIRSLCVIRRGLARYSSLADTMFAMQGLGSYPITLAGSDSLKQKFLTQVTSGEAIATFALTEPLAGSDAASIRTVARREGGEYILDGDKKFISNGGIADFYVVFAKTDPALGRKGMSAIVVEKDRPGFTTNALEVIAPHPIGEVHMEGCRVPVENLLGREGEGYSIVMRTLESFRTTVGAAALGLAERALQEATSYTKGRVQFGKALSEFQGLRFMLADMATEIEASRVLVFQAAAKLDTARNAGREDPSSVLASSMAKLYATETAQQVIDRALQMHGGTGVLKGTVVERLYREIRALRVYEGASEVQKEIIAHQLLRASQNGSTAAPPKAS
ncbi:MAG: acyl-CoA dehydrogenase family protein [Acidobacteria bacterium]|nr:acyl-CoA dehydrogenase family protein [Acidobacteriota bacterium]